MNPNDVKDISSTKNKPVHHRTWAHSAFSTSLRDRPVVFNPQHIDDHGRKYSININERRDWRIDEGSLLISHDPDSIFYRHLCEKLQGTPATASRPIDEKEKVKAFEPYGPELIEFIVDKQGNLKSKFDKVFIT